MRADAAALPSALSTAGSAAPLARALGSAAPTLLGLLFVLSGAAGLIYESIWARYLGLFLGHSAYAQVLVLAIFLGGMSVGALIAGGRSERLRRPLLWYAAIEAAAGIVGLLFHGLYIGTTRYALAVIFPALSGAPVLLSIAKYGLGAALILPQSLLLGTTFPLMSAGVVRHLPDQPGRVIALLYFANSIGAAGGVLLSGFWLIPRVGLPGTVLTAALANMAVALGAYSLARTLPERAPLAAAPPLPGTALPRRRLSLLLLGVTFGTAVASFIYEITWIRMLSLVLGSATHAFELMLSAFILGLALGALCVRPVVDGEAVPLRALAQVQWAMGAFALATLPVYAASFGWVAELLQTFARTPAGYGGFNLARYALCLGVMLPSTFCAGMTLPLLTRSLLSNGCGERAVGWVYGVNTLGSIVGVVLAGLLLLPWLGLQTLLVTGAALDMALGVLVLGAAGPTRAAGMRRALLYSLATAAVALAIGATTRLDPVLLSSGVFRTATLPPPGSRQVLFHRDGRTASVDVFRTVGNADLSLATNGKVDASLNTDWFGAPPPRHPALRADSATQVLLALTSLAHRPAARTAAVVGLGSGVSSHFLLGSPALARLTTIEIEPAMVDAARWFYPANRRTFDDPRSELAIDDAKSFFAAAPAPFDLILSEPSNPWVSGVSSLFGGEFYALVARHLSDDGVFGQWLHLYELDDLLVLSVLAAVHAHFADYAVYVVGYRDVLIVATKHGALPPPDWSVFEQPAIAADLARFVPFTPAILASTRILHRAALAPVLDLGFQPNSDFFPVLDAGAEQARFLNGAAHGVIGLSTDRFALTETLLDRYPPATEPATPVTYEPRFERRARAARLRAALAAGDFAALIADDSDSAAAYRLWQWQTLVSSERPPADWRRWVADTIAIDDDLHAGSAGVPDRRFYDLVHAYLRAHAAPVEARDALQFIEALASWDFPTAASLADRLLPEARAGRSWVPPRVLLDGGVIAKLRQGDVEGARALRDALTHQSGRPPGDLRRILIDAYIAQPQVLAAPLAR